MAALERIRIKRPQVSVRRWSLVKKDSWTASSINPALAIDRAISQLSPNERLSSPFLTVQVSQATAKLLNHLPVLHFTPHAVSGLRSDNTITN
ncbi:uncharacterized [Tachysurus ichikawai]